jgi:hypothetical protein
MRTPAQRHATILCVIEPERVEDDEDRLKTPTERLNRTAPSRYASGIDATAHSSENDRRAMSEAPTTASQTRNTR